MSRPGSRILSRPASTLPNSVEQLAASVGDTVDLQNGTRGIVRYVGLTSFSPGKWVGIELVEAVGKHDGVVQGKRYFKCPMNHGVFVKPAQVLQVVSPQSKKPMARKVS